MEPKNSNAGAECDWRYRSDDEMARVSREIDEYDPIVQRAIEAEWSRRPWLHGSQQSDSGAQANRAAQSVVKSTLARDLFTSARSTAIILIILGWLWFVWPTPYNYGHFQGEGYRVNRFTGVKEVSTEKGWRSQEEIAKEAKFAGARHNAELVEKLKPIRQSLQDIRVDDARDEFDKIAINNPTKWVLSENFGGTVVEYYKIDRAGNESFLAKKIPGTEIGVTLGSETHTEVDLGDEPNEVRELTAPAEFVQRIIITLSKIVGPGLDYDTTLDPPFVLKHDRRWTRTSR